MGDTHPQFSMNLSKEAQATTKRRYLMHIGHFVKELYARLESTMIDFRNSFGTKEACSGQ